MNASDERERWTRAMDASDERKRRTHAAVDLRERAAHRDKTQALTSRAVRPLAHGKVGIAITFVWAQVLSGNELASDELNPCKESSLLSSWLLLSNLVASPCFSDLW